MQQSLDRWIIDICYISFSSHVFFLFSSVLFLSYCIYHTQSLDRWIIDICYISQWKKLAVLCHDSTLSIYDVNCTNTKSYDKVAM
jgi:hypothetical protein